MGRDFSATSSVKSGKYRLYKTPIQNPSKIHRSRDSWFNSFSLQQLETGGKAMSIASFTSSPLNQLPEANLDYSALKLTLIHDFVSHPTLPSFISWISYNAGYPCFQNSRVRPRKPGSSLFTSCKSPGCYLWSCYPTSDWPMSLFMLVQHQLNKNPNSSDHTLWGKIGLERDSANLLPLFCATEWWNRVGWRRSYGVTRIPKI